jgi:hypothetical protein
VESHHVARRLKPFPTLGYVASQAFILLILALGVAIAYLVALASFSVPQMPLWLGQFLGITVGMEAPLGIPWGTSVLTGRILERRRHVLGSRDDERRTTRN